MRRASFGNQNVGSEPPGLSGASHAGRPSRQLSGCGLVRGGWNDCHTHSVPQRAVNTNYPESETTELRLELPAPADFTLYVRIPGWLKSRAEFRVNERAISVHQTEARPKLPVQQLGVVANDFKAAALRRALGSEGADNHMASPPHRPKAEYIISRTLCSRRLVAEARAGRIVSLHYGTLVATLMTCEGMAVRRGVYLLLTVLLVQLSGLRLLCVPGHCQTHACCPMSTNTTPPSSSSLPACCLNFLLNYQGSITETQSAGHPSEYTGQLGEISHPSAVPRVPTSAPVRQHMLPSISPPLSPLSQSCLLLI
jgi:hypothetical protein